MPARRTFPRTSLWIVMLSLVLLAGCAGLSSGHAPNDLNGVKAVLPSPTLAPTSGGFSGAALREQLIHQTVEKMLSGMTLDEKLGQLFLIESTYKTYSQDVDNMVVGMHAGAMIVYQQNITDWQQLHDMLATIQAHAAIPMLVTMDEEGGGVDRLGNNNLAPPLPSAQTMAASGNPQFAYNEGVTAAKEMMALGINTNLAPVVDVRTTPAAMEWDRLFGNDPTTVDRYAGEFLQWAAR